MISRGKGHVHMVGACGIGMAGVSYLLKQRGFTVSGCDAGLNRQAEWLKGSGIPIDCPQSAGHLDETVDWVVMTPAVAMDCPEIVRARELGIPVSRRGEVLPALLGEGESVAVAGTHGKTTTATLIAQLLKAAGRDPSWCIGGESAPLGAVAGTGKDAVTVVEADESDGTLALYHPEIAVVTNIEYDHMEHFESEEDFNACFTAFIHQTRRRVLYCADDERATRQCAALPHAVGYGFGEEAGLRGELREVSAGSELCIQRDGVELGTVTVPIPGRHNAANALAAVGVCLELGLTFDSIGEAISAISLPRRRFEVVAQSGGVTVVSDYAHHPSEIAALIQTARREHTGRLLAVFQPHRYSRTKALGGDFPAAFDGVDQLVLAPVYPASEPPLTGGRACDLYVQFVAQGCDSPRLATSLEQAWAYLRRELREGDMLLVIGAGDVEQIGMWAGEETGNRSQESGGREQESGVGELKLRLSDSSRLSEDEPLGKKTTYGVGGTADIWVEVGCVEDLAEILSWRHAQGVPFRVLGAGSNVLVSDLGVRGVVVRLTGDVFRSIRHESGEVVAGGAVPLVRLLDWAETESLTGVEFLEGVPGGVGGIVRMNGGAYGHEVAERLSWIRGLNPDGSECTLHASALEWGYRGCEALAEVVIVEVGLLLDPGCQGEIAAARRRIAGKRAWMRGLRCSGSVFRNPPGQYAGRIIENLGLKGRRIGGAHVYGRHGNFIVADRDATASDVLALIQQVQAAVYDETGIELVREVIFLE